jgi:hypothetical protein
MRVLLVSEPGVDGVFRHVEALAAFLQACGHRIFGACLRECLFQRAWIKVNDMHVELCFASKSRCQSNQLPLSSTRGQGHG